MRLLVTRPESDAKRTALALRARGHAVLVAPLLAFQIIDDVALAAGPWGGVLLTSAHAARAIARRGERAALIDLPVLAVGEHTAEAARRGGFANVASAAGNAGDLVRLAAERFADAPAPLLYLAGEDRALDIAGALAARGVRVETAVVYRMAMAQCFPTDIAAALSSRAIDGVLHYSGRSAEAYLRCADAGALRQAALAPTHYCISTEASRPLAAAGASDLRIAARPDEPALLDCLDAG